MAKNWKVGEAVVAIKSGAKEDILDIGRRFPLFANLAAQVNEAGVEMLKCVPDYISARKIESVLKGEVQENEEGSDDEGAEEEKETKVEPKAGKATKAAKETKSEPAKKNEDALEGKTPKQLFDMCKDAGLNVKPKQDKAVYIEALKRADEAQGEDDADWEEEEEEKPAKKPAKETKPAKKPAKAKVEEEEDDWDL